jgi:hypothetical protein
VLGAERPDRAAASSSPGGKRGALLSGSRDWIDPVVDSYVITERLEDIIEAAETGRRLPALSLEKNGRPSIVDDAFLQAAHAKAWGTLIARRTELAKHDQYLVGQPSYVLSLSACDPEMYRAALGADWWRLLKLSGQWLQRTPDDVLAAWLAVEAYNRVNRRTVTVKRAMVLLCDRGQFDDYPPESLFWQPMLYFSAECLLADPGSPSAWALYANVMANGGGDEGTSSEAVAMHAASRAVLLAPRDAVALRILGEVSANAGRAVGWENSRHRDTPYETLEHLTETQ